MIPRAIRHARLSPERTNRVLWSIVAGLVMVGFAALVAFHPRIALAWFTIGLMVLWVFVCLCRAGGEEQ